MKVLSESILRFETLPSTNTEAVRRAIEGADEGLCVIAGEQTAGRGRLQRGWVSPRGAGLYFSIVFRPRIKESAWPLITLAAALAVHDALLEACDLKTDIKWPNDIVVNQRKLCGMLAETVETKKGRAAVLGIGVNFTTDGFPDELRETTTSVQAETGKRVDPEAFLTVLLCSLERRYEELQSPRGDEETIREWCKRSSYANEKRIRMTNAGEVFEGTTRGLESDGGLRVETDSGEIKVVRAGDVMLVRECRNQS